MVVEMRIGNDMHVPLICGCLHAGRERCKSFGWSSKISPAIYERETTNLTTGRSVCHGTDVFYAYLLLMTTKKAIFNVGGVSLI
jgi:hypothetical protein